LLSIQTLRVAFHSLAVRTTKNNVLKVAAIITHWRIIKKRKVIIQTDNIRTPLKEANAYIDDIVDKHTQDAYNKLLNSRLHVG
tara:strand:- start:338501 stop:338749 length:249 start_codon:yes stop_codon:yes gene_type:complete